MMYTQALVDGYQVIVEANGTRLDYRGSAPGKFRIRAEPLITLPAHVARRGAI